MKSGRKSDYFVVIILFVVFTALIVMNARLISRMMTEQTEQIGQTQLDTIKNDFETGMSEAENTLIRVASGAEQIMNADGSMEELSDYIYDQKKTQMELSNGNNFNVYIASQGWEIIPDFDIPTDYHATERGWYVGAVDSDGEIYITSPYIDSMTGDMCYTMSVLLSDKVTVVSMDFTLSRLQQSVNRMTEDEMNTALISTADGMIIGYKDVGYVGKDLKKVLPEYSDVLKSVINNSKSQKYFNSDINGEKYTVFYAVTKNEWYMILCVNNEALYGNTTRQMVMNILINVILLLTVVVLYLIGSRNRRKAEEALRSREAFVNGVSLKLRKPIRKIMHLSTLERYNSSENMEADITDIKTAAIQMNNVVEDLSSYSSIVSDMNKKKKASKKLKKNITRSIRVIRDAIIVVLVLISLVSTYFFYDSSGQVMDEVIIETLINYHREFEIWETEQMTVLGMFTDFISNEPEILDDYEGAVKWMDDIAKNYKDISVCYMANPYKEHTVIMNNGWQPDDDWKVEERDWYKQTEKSSQGYSISAPYFDEQTGKYCVTMSKVVYGKNGEFLGIFGIDFYMEKLISIFGEGYNSNEYVFMVDPNGIIINHPNENYQMSSVSSVNIDDTPYKIIKEFQPNFTTHLIRDYNGKLCKCSYERDASTGFSIIIVRDFWETATTEILYCGIYLFIIMITLIIIIILLNRVIKSQAYMNQELSEAAEKATAAGKAKSDFLAQMSHEIRTPINAVIGMDEMILRESTEPEILEYAETIKNASNTLLVLINGILDFSKIESGRMEIIQVKYETLGLIDDLVSMVSVKAEEKGLKLITEIDSTLPKIMYGDDVRIKQVITNILMNAVKYTEEGSVTLSVKCVNKDEESCTINVAVKDTGIGIREEDMKKLFKSFQRLDEEKNRDIEGTGLGMSIVQGLLEMMDSKLDVESEYGKGSVFSFDIQQSVIDNSEIGEYEGHKESRIEEHTDKSKQMDFSSAQILVVDDNKMNLKVVKGLMKQSGVVPVLAESGNECIEKVKNQHFDMILMDHMMPVMDGIETLQKMKESDILPEDTVVIALTANAISGAREMYMKEGFKDYLSKPIDPDKLDKMLKQYLPESKVQVKEAPEAKAVEAAVNSGETYEPVILEFFPEEAEAEEEEEKTFISRLRNAGFNIDAAMKYCMNDEALYLDLLETFACDEVSKIDEIKEKYDNENWNDYRILVHALKSSSRTIGADELSQQALSHENAAKQENLEFIKSDVNSLLEKYGQVVTMIKESIG